MMRPGPANSFQFVNRSVRGVVLQASSEGEANMQGLTRRATILAAAGTMLGAAGTVTPGARAGSADLRDAATKTVAAWVAAVTSGDEETVAAALAPEFQIVRDNGVAYDRAEYLAGGLPKIATPPPVSDLVATGEGDVMVVRYVLTISATVDGAPMQARAPRLTVFRRVGTKWLVAAHANFAAIGK